jgi:MYXO-CTERM domain-containing protein
MVNVVFSWFRSETMISPHPSQRRRLLAGALLTAGALTLMAPTCGTMTPGTKTFSRRSLIIPMDLCYQALPDDVSGTGGYSAVGCPQGAKGAPGDVLKAYGLVYQLVRANIAVYWVIAQSKGSTTDVDMSVQYGGGPPVWKFDWSSGAPGSTSPTTASKIDYRGGPFVIDGSDYDAAVAIMRANSATFSAVNVHVANVAFQGYVAKTMAGGWSAGGATPPKLALLNIASDGISGGAQNAESVIQSYLTRAGLDTPSAGGTASGTHGQIYDKLDMTDFLPDASGNPATSRLFQNGYQILWVPHWAAPGSCSNVASCSRTHYGTATVNQALTVMGAFSAAGKDVFAECAGIGSFEGVTADLSGMSTPAGFGAGVASTHFLTGPTTGFSVNAWNGTNGTDTTVLRGNYSSPLMQIGDYPFYAEFGAIDDFRPVGYLPGEITFASAGSHSTYDVFSMMPPVAGGHGTTVYLAGHSYSKKDVVGVFEVAGSRLVLNTLFNLGAACVETGVSCNTGLLGECAQGVMSCDSSGTPYCKQIKNPQPEVCDGKDNDCNGLVDDGLDVACYDGPASSLDPTTGLPRGICQAGVSSCVELSPGTWGMSACMGEVLPAAQESCNGLDNDCDGQVGNVPGTTTPLSQACYTGPSNTVDPLTGFPRGICKAGQSTCTNGAWSACAVCPDTDPPPWRDGLNHDSCEILPHTQICGTEGSPSPDATYDMTCSGVIACSCTSGTTSCYDGPPATRDVGACRSGTRTCTDGSWGSCVGQVLPKARDCSSSVDNDCNGLPDSGEAACQSTSCPLPTNELRICRVQGAERYPPTGTETIGDPMGVCRDGLRSCNPDGSLGECAGMIPPSPEICDGKDNNCDGNVDENPDSLCNSGFTCVHGLCVPASCGVESPCPEGYACSIPSGEFAGTCVPALCGTGAAAKICDVAQKCQYGFCVDPCAGVTCATGAFCSSGFCTGGGCYLAGCPSGQACLQGQCEPDPCSAVACPLGTFCRSGDCVQSCVYVSCTGGAICSVDGFCETDPCQGVTCEAGQTCVEGACQADPCADKFCGPRQVCSQGVCQDDPCNSVSCPVGACNNGQCWAATKPDTSHPTTTTSGSGGGCGCGSGDSSPLGALLLLLLLPLARRRRPFRGGAARAALLSLAAVAVLSAAACKGGSKSSTDYSTCTETCGESRCIDLNYDAAHCGHCGTACEAGQICRDGVCGPSSAVAPYIQSVDPNQANHGLLNTVPVTLTGERFQDKATVRAIMGSGSVTYPATLVDATHLTAELDLADVPISQLALRVVNPDNVISNGVVFDVVSVAPSISSVTPASVTTGSVTTLQVAGTGFAATSLCHASGSTMPEVVMATTPVTVGGVTALACVFDATPATVQPGSYDLWVVNDGVAASNHLTLTVVSSVATLASLSPSSAEAGSAVDIDVTGTGFDFTSVAYFQWSTGPATAATNTVVLDATHLLILGQLLPASPDTASVSVHNGSVVSTNSLPFHAVAKGGAVQVTNLTVSPAPLYQGQNATLTFAGTAFPAGTPTITVTAPTGATVNATGVTASATSASGTVALSSLSPEPAGTYSAFVVFSDGTVSSSFQFPVLSSVAVLQSATPAGAKQGTSPTVKLKIGNVHGTPAVHITGGGTTIDGTGVVLQPPGTDPTLWQATFDLTNRNTGIYALYVQNPGAQPSNQISFTILPGLPAITTLSPPCAVQGNTVATVTITGQNFALPDSQGNALSHVMYSSDGVTFFAIPATVTVNSATQITVQLDTRNAVADTTYAVQVWNPNDPTTGTPQHSGSASFRVAASSCP